MRELNTIQKREKLNTVYAVDEKGNKILGVRYSECLALECAYLRSKLGA